VRQTIISEGRRTGLGPSVMMETLRTRQKPTDAEVEQHKSFPPRVRCYHMNGEERVGTRGNRNRVPARAHHALYVERSLLSSLRRLDKIKSTRFCRRPETDEVIGESTTCAALALRPPVIILVHIITACTTACNIHRCMDSIYAYFGLFPRYYRRV